MSDKIDKVIARKGVVAAEFLSSSYRISGEVVLKGQPVVDSMNDKMSNFIRAENIYVSPISDPAVLKAHYTFGQLRKENISMVVINREEDGASRHSIYHTQPNQPIIFSLFATVSGFEVRGGLKINSLTDVDNLLMQSVDRFITIYRATARAAENQAIEFSGGAILLNRESVNIVCVDKAVQ